MAEIDSMAPALLLAMPQLLDPNFRRAVVLVTAHAAEGAMGFVVNRVLPISVEEVLSGLAIPWKGGSSERVWQGGPVMPQAGWVLFEQPRGAPIDEAQEILPGLWLTASIQALRQLALAPPKRFRLLLGHAAWGTDQLEAELVEGSWLLSAPDPSLLFESAPEKMWEDAYRRLGVDPSSVVPGAGVQ